MSGVGDNDGGGRVDNGQYVGQSARLGVWDKIG